MPSSPRRIKSKNPQGFGELQPYGVYIGLLREWVALGEPPIPLVPTIYDLRKRTREVLGD